MKIIGIDPGTATTGFGLIDCASSKRKKLIAYGEIKTQKELSLSHRLVQIGADLEVIIKKYQPEIASVEKLFFCKNITTAISVAHARGVILFILEKYNIPVLEYTPLQVKQGLTGYGKATKKNMQDMVKIELKLEQIPKPDDAADALALAIIAINEAKNLSKKQ
jgi:crossover junction endodeoxyribonuclease RuvC